MLLAMVLAGPHVRPCATDSLNITAAVSSPVSSSESQLCAWDCTEQRPAGGPWEAAVLGQDTRPRWVSAAA